MRAHTLPWNAGIDIGGTGLRLRFIPSTGESIEENHEFSHEPVSLVDVAELLLSLAAEHSITRIQRVAVSMTGYPPPSSEAALLADALADIDTQWLLIGSDGLAAYHAALGPRPGVVCAAGTGVIVVARDAAGRFRQVDGHGPIAGDLGSGYWIGQAALRAALRDRDRGAVTAWTALADRFETRHAEIGPSLALPEDRAVIARLAEEVLLLAADSAEAARITAEAADHLSASIAIAHDALRVQDASVAFTGRLFRNESFRADVRERVAHRIGGGRIIHALRSPLDGAADMAARGADPSSGQLATIFTRSATTRI